MNEQIVKNDCENNIKELENNLDNMVNNARVKSKCSWYSVLEISIFLKNLRKEKCNPRTSSETYCQQSINSRPEKKCKTSFNSSN